jgi:glycosyltransferase involved in cell wall biosynthesis
MIRLCFLADARSPIAMNWINHFIGRAGYEIHLISSYAHTLKDLPIQVHTLPIGIGRFLKPPPAPSPVGAIANKPPAKTRLNRLRSGSLGPLFNLALAYYGNLDVFAQRRALATLIRQIQPDLLHAMRIPFEGIAAALAASKPIKLIVSVWGNDFTLFANQYPLMAWQTRQTLRRADALHADCQRDMRLARNPWGFAAAKLGLVVPGNGGIRGEVFFPAPQNTSTLRNVLNIPAEAPVVVNARGVRDYVRNDLFFKAAAQVIQKKPGVVFVCLGMAGNSTVEKWIADLGIQANVRLIGGLPHHEMADLFRLGMVAASPSLHDGTPNTLLEAMACGAFPVAGDIESVREWITDGQNGLLFPVLDVERQTKALLHALDDQALRAQALAQNLELIATRAAYKVAMAQAEAFYATVLGRD